MLVLISPVQPGCPRETAVINTRMIGFWPRGFPILLAGNFLIFFAAQTCVGGKSARQPLEPRALFSSTGPQDANARAQQTARADLVIAPGTILPIRVPGISSKKNSKGKVIRARIMQEVPLENGAKIRAGTTVLGHVVEVSATGPAQQATLALKFDTLVEGDRSIPIVTNLRALASTLEVESAQIPPIGPGESDVYEWLTTVQVGGDVVYGQGGVVTSGGRVVGRAVNNGVLVQISAKPETRCRGPVQGNDRPQALWVFSSDACGIYGFPHLRIAHAGRTEPVGEIVLASDDGPVNIRSGSGMLLRVER